MPTKTKQSRVNTISILDHIATDNAYFNYHAIKHKSQYNIFRDVLLTKTKHLQLVINKFLFENKYG